VQRDALSQLFQSRGHQLEISIETDQPAAMQRLVVAGMGVGIATQIAFDEIDNAIAVLPIAGDDVPRFNVFVFEDVSRPIRPESPAIRAVKQLLLEAVQATEGKTSADREE